MPFSLCFIVAYLLFLNNAHVLSYKNNESFKKEKPYCLSHIHTQWGGRNVGSECEKKNKAQINIKL